MGWHSSFANRIKITIDSSLIDSDLTDFPVTLNLSVDSGTNSLDLTRLFDQLGSNDKKIAITTDDGTTECYVEIENWDATNQKATLHVKVPLVSSSTDTVIYLYYDAVADDNTTYVGDTGDAAAQSVWDSNFLGVYHLAQDPTGGADCMLDSTSNANHGTPAGSMTAGDLVDALNSAKGQDLDGTDDAIGMKTNLGALSDFCFEVLAKWDDLATRRSLISNYEDSNDSWMFGFHPSDGLYLYEEEGGANTISESVGAITSMGTSAYHYMVCNRSGADINFMLDADPDYGSGSDSTTLKALTTNHGIAVNMPLASTYEEFDGIVSEVRISDDDRSDAWLKATYYSLFDSLVSYEVTPAWLDGFKHRFKLTIDSSLIDADLVDFPVAIRIHAQSGIENSDLTEIFDHLGSSSTNLAVTTADGETQCYVEIELWDDTNEEAVLHVKVPSISADVDTVLYLYYDSEATANTTYVGVTGSTPGQTVWDSDFEAVYHMAQDPSGGSGCILDSTANGNDGTPMGTMLTGDLVDGQIGKAINFDGNDDGIDVGNIGAGAGFSALTVEALAKNDAAAISSNEYIVSKDGSGENTGDGSMWIDAAIDNFGWHNYSANGDVDGAGAINEWTHIVYTYGSSAHELFENGASVDTNSAAISAWANATNVQIGTVLTGSYGFGGDIGEVRISSAVRSDAWIKATYYTLNDKLLTASVREDWTPGFANRIKVTIDSDLVDSTLSDFPVLLRIAEDAGISGADVSRIFSIIGADTNSKKIAVTTSDGLTQCKVEIDFWDTENKVAHLWVKVPSVSSSADTDLYFYFDGSVEDNIENVGDTGDEPAQEVWDEDFALVMHMSQDPSGGSDCMLDSTANANHGTPSGSMTTGDLVDGLQGAKAIDFDGTDDIITLSGYKGTSGSQNRTTELIIKMPTRDSTDRRILGWGDETTDGEKWHLRTEDSLETDPGSFRAEVQGASSTSGSTAIDDNEWHHAVATLNGSTQGDIELTIDGNAITETESSPSQAVNTDTAGGRDVTIGGANATTWYYHIGQIGEVRISDIARSDAWIKASYHASFDTLITWGEYEQREFKKYRKFTVDSDLIDEDLTDFPLAIALSTSAGIGDEDLSDFFAELAYPAGDQFKTPESGAFDTKRWTLVGQTGNVTNTADALNCNADSGDVSGEWQGVKSNFRLSSEDDFDVQVDFEVTSGPATDNWYINLVASFQTSFAASPTWDTAVLCRRGYNSTYSGQMIEGLKVEDASWGTTDRDAVSATSGKLRITLTASTNTVTTYYDVGSGWTQGGQWSFTDFDSQDAQIILAAVSLGSQPTVTVNFTNFKVNSGVVLYPDGEPNRKKIKVTYGDLVTQCYVEVDHLDCANQVGMLHAKIPHIDASADTDIYLHYDADQPDNDDYVGDVGDAAAQNVWDNDFVAVYHMNQDPSGGADAILDSTSNGRDMTASNMEAGDLIDSEPGKGLDFDGSNEICYVNISGVLTDYPATLEVAGPATVTAASNNNPAIGIGDKDASDQMILLNMYGDIGRLNFYSSASNVVDGTATLSADEMVHLAVVLTDSTDRALFTNGGDKQSDVDSDAWPSGVDRIAVGATPDSTVGYRAGEVSEARVSSSARSDAWIEATYLCLSDAIGSWDTTVKGAWFRSWAHRRKFTVDADNIDDILIDFPIAMVLNSSAGIGDDDVTGVFSEIATADRLKIAVTDRSGLNQLFVEVEQWDSSNSKAMIHIKVPELFYNKDTEFYLYYDSNQGDNTDWIGDPGDTPAAAVWDKNFIGVYHMAEDPTGGTMVDSTLNQDADTVGSWASNQSVDGPAGLALDFQSSHALELGDVFDSILAGSSAKCTHEVVFNADAITSNCLTSKYNSGSNDRGWIMRLYDYSIERVSLHYEDKAVSDRREFGGGTTLSVSTWYYTAGQYDATAGTGNDGADRLTLFLDGEEETLSSVDTSGSVVNMEDNAAYFGIGATLDTSGAIQGGQFDGKIAEVRFSDILRDAWWIKATNYVLTDALGTWGSEEDFSTGADVTVTVGTPGITYTAQAALVGVDVPVGTPGIAYTAQAAGAGVGADVDTPGITYAVNSVSIIQNFKAIGVMSKPIVTGGGPGATATGRQPGATADGAGPTANVTGKGE